MDNLGEYIRSQREAKKMTIEELSEKTKISCAVLRDIETGRFDRYKGDEAYVKMYLKKISEVLLMDIEDVTQQYVDLTREIDKELLFEQEEKKSESEKNHFKGKKFSFEAPQFTRNKSVYEDKSHVTIVRTAIILLLVCLVIAVVWYGIYKTRSSSDNPNFVPGNNATVEGDVNTPSEDEPQPGNDTNTPTDTGITITRQDQLKFDFTLPKNTEKFIFKIEFMTKSWSQLYVNGKVYNDFEATIYHNNNTNQPETIEVEFTVSEFNSLRLRQGYSMGHRYYINNQQIPLTDEDYSEGSSYLDLNLVSE